MIELTMLSLAYEASKNELRRKHEEKMREMERWEDERLLPLMTAEQRADFLAERRRRKERKEDIERQERHHKERLAVERRKAAAMEEQAREARRGNDRERWRRW